MQASQWDIIIRKPSPAEMRQWARFRGWTIRILEELEHSGGLTVAQISDRLNHRRTDIRRFCRRLFCSGCIEPLERWGWKITSTGELLLSIQTEDTNRTLTGHKEDTNRTHRQLTLAPYSNSEYSEPELAVTNLLISHYNATGQPFIFIEDKIELCEELGIPLDVMAATMRKLYQEKVCYMYDDKRFGKPQLRLYKPFLERLQHC